MSPRRFLIACHGQETTPLDLAPLRSGRTTFTEEESRKNFEAVSHFVVPGNLKSKLLTHPLQEQAGGDFYHNGGKHFASQNDPEWKMLADWVDQSSGTPSASPTQSTAPASLDFRFYKTKVEPIFLKQRPGHARCYSCHTLSNRSLHLEMLSPGSAEWTDEQSQRNFQSALRQVVPGDGTANTSGTQFRRHRAGVTMGYGQLLRARPSVCKCLGYVDGPLTSAIRH